MKTEKIKSMMDVCYEAKRILDMLPKLPAGIAPSYIRFLDRIECLEQESGKVYLSDLSTDLNLPRPGVTRTIKEMEAKGYVEKRTSDTDGRMTYLVITQAGKALSQKYNGDYFSGLAKDLETMDEEDIDVAIDTIHKVYEIMKGRKNHVA